MSPIAECSQNAFKSDEVDLAILRALRREKLGFLIIVILSASKCYNILRVILECIYI